MLLDMFNELQKSTKNGKSDILETKEMFLNWLANHYQVQPTFVSPWMPLSFVEHAESEKFFEWLQGNIEEFLEELSVLFGLPTYDEAKEEVQKMVNELPYVNSNYPDPILIYKPGMSHWFMYECYFKDFSEKSYIFYIIENEEVAHKVSFLLNSIINKNTFNLYYPLDEPNSKESIELLEPTDSVWTLANLWKPNATKLRRLQRFITRKVS